MVDCSYVVYKHTCPNGKVYIGITGQNPLKRWCNGKGYRDNKHFYNAIKKYGWENILHEILFEDLTKEDACKKEVELISEYKSSNTKYGYNQDNGGNCIGKMTEETKSKIRKKMSNIKRKPLSEETKRKISENRKGIRPNRIYKPMSEEQKRKLSEERKGKSLPKEIIIKIFETRKGYRHSEETREKISRANKGKQSPNKGIPMSEEQKLLIGNANKKKILQYSQDGTFIKEWNGAIDVERELGIKRKHISSAISNKTRRRTAGGYVWKIKEAK